ncbi:arylesterase [Novosphingobium sp. PC22D]|uniref:arylesterase n=1 Tax=Novosphingobium sp. PC22D TaxID=1962403 RepID=UPI000BEF889C|nr:arylesterase [Novosphingobium sp. PC22D]PEQ14277.1 arylesterase [Novosphingobium sp. PC22D]
MKFPRLALAALVATGLAACGQEPANDPGAPGVSEAASGSGDAAREELPVMGPERHILAFGDSLLAGYGLEDGEGYPARLEAALRAKGINARMSDAAVSGDTTAAGLQRLAFALDSQKTKPDLAIVSLGGNDMLRGLPPAETRANLEKILATFRERGIKVVLLGMLAAPNLGKDYAARFNPIYPSLAQAYDAELVPFFLQPVIDKPEMMQDDHVHPTRLGIEEMVAATIDDVADALPDAKGAGQAEN